jgi:glycerate-2-kinase
VEPRRTTEASLEQLREPGLRNEAEMIFRAALEGVEPSRLVVRAFQALPSALREALAARRGRLAILGAGKAAGAMVAALEDALPPPKLPKGVQPPPPLEGIVVLKRGAKAPGTRRLDVRFAGHPVPDEDGLAAALAMLHLAGSLGESDLAFALFSGGASALLPAPVEGVTLDELRATTELLLASGASIHELNAVRKHLSRLAGGQLARACRAAALIGFVISDVPGDRLDSVASGPTVADETTFREAFATLKDRGLLERVPPPVRKHIELGARGKLPETPKPGDRSLARSRTILIGSNRTALEAAAALARERGFQPIILQGALTGDAREVGETFGQRLLQLRAKETGGRRAVIAGGEATLAVAGPGKGGRCQEIALAAAKVMAGTPGVCLLVGGTDGEDGPTDAAGAVVDGATIADARLAKQDPEKAQARNDCYPLFEAIGALVRTGPTGTNVMDVGIGLVL